MAHTIKEIIDIAVGIEETGYEFYTSCAGQLKDPATSDAFEFLAKEELVHKDLFLSLRDNDQETSRPNAEEYYRYLRAIGGEGIFEKHKLDINRISSDITAPMAAIKKAFILEKESILFYSEMKQLYGEDREPIELIDKIIAEERKHVAVLYDLSQKIRFT